MRSASRLASFPLRGRDARLCWSNPPLCFWALPPPVHAGSRNLCAKQDPRPADRYATGLEPFHHAGTALKHGYTRIDTWPRLCNADKAWRNISSYCPTEPTPLAFQRELWQLPLGKDTIQSIAKPYADFRIKHIVDSALEAERNVGIVSWS